jgi:PAS domain S-box-containing protein
VTDAQSAPDSPPPVTDGRDATIARLEQDVTRLRRLLRDYDEARETTQDVLRASEQRYRDSEDRYRTLIQRAAYGIFRATLDGRFLDVNPALVRTLGYPTADALLTTDARSIHYDGADQARLLAQAAAGELPGWTEVRWRRRDGAPILIRLTMQVVRDADGAPIALEGITEDVTDRARNDELLRRSERMASLGHMLAGVAHELNNPLAAISGFAQLMLNQALSDEDRSAVETINHEAQRAAKIVRDLLAFSRRQEEQRRERVDLNDVVRYILDAQRYQIETRGIRRELSLAAGLPPVLAQASQLEQVVLNLVVNARQALEESIDAFVVEPPAEQSNARPLITIRTAVAGAFITLEVADNGPGIREEHRGRIWDPFWTTKDEGRGTGLGLPVVYGIVTTYGGTIEMETELGAGTRFLVRLPAAPPAGTGSETSESTLAAPALQAAAWPLGSRAG